MGGSFELGTPDVFTAGTVGDPGARVFYLQIRDGEVVLSFKCEKQQVSALAEYLAGLLDDLEPVPLGELPGSLELAEPPQPVWTVGPIGVAYDEPADRIVVVLEELVDEAEAVDSEALVAAAGSARVQLSRAQAVAFVDRSRELVAAGRPPCRFCGLPLDPEGHLCPRMN